MRVPGYSVCNRCCACPRADARPVSVVVGSASRLQPALPTHATTTKDDSPADHARPALVITASPFHFDTETVARFPGPRCDHRTHPNGRTATSTTIAITAGNNFLPNERITRCRTIIAC